MAMARMQDQGIMDQITQGYQTEKQIQEAELDMKQAIEQSKIDEIQARSGEGEAGGFAGLAGGTMAQSVYGMLKSRKTMKLINLLKDKYQSVKAGEQGEIEEGEPAELAEVGEEGVEMMRLPTTTETPTAEGEAFAPSDYPETPTARIPAGEPEGEMPTAISEGTDLANVAQMGGQESELVAGVREVAGSQLSTLTDSLGINLSKLTGSLGEMGGEIGEQISGLAASGSSIFDALGPIMMVAGLGMGIYSSIEQAKEYKEEVRKAKMITQDLQNYAESPAVSMGSMALPSLDSTQFRQGGMMNF